MPLHSAHLLFAAALSAVMAAGCGERCDATATSLGDASHSASLVWHAGVGEATMTYDSLGDPGPRAGEVSDDGVTHRALLWGLPPLSEVAYRFTDTRSNESCTDVFVSSGLEPGLPKLDVTLNTGQSPEGWHYIAGVAMGKSGMLFIADRRGALRWHALHDPALSVSAVHLEGETLYYNSFDAKRTEDLGHIHARPLRGDDTTDIRTEGAHHTFVRLPDGTLAFPAVDIRPVTDPDSGDEIDIVGDRIVEISPDGISRELWSAWDHEEVDLGLVRPTDFYGELGLDWTHANGLSYSPQRDTYLISLGHLDTIYEIERSSGAVRWRLHASDVVSGAAFHFQHNPHWTDAGTLLMMSYPEGGGATAIEYSLDEDGRLREVWSYTRENGGVTLLGEAHRLPNSSTLINYGGMGELREVTPEGTVTWQLNAGIGAWFGSIVLLDALP